MGIGNGEWGTGEQGTENGGGGFGNGEWEIWVKNLSRRGAESAERVNGGDLENGVRILFLGLQAGQRHKPKPKTKILDRMTGWAGFF
jgi:hypothetical protein